MLTLANRRPVRGRAFSLLRALLPSWRFFEDAGTTLRFETRVRQTPSTAWGEWQDAYPPVRPSIASILHNPSGSFRFACHSLVDQLVSDVNETTDDRLAGISESVSYRLVARLARSRVVVQSSPTSSRTEFQFRVRADSSHVGGMRSDTQEETSGDIVVSIPMSVTAP